MDFKALGLRAELIQAVADLGFSDPMPIQERAIPVLLSGEKDFVGLAQTGTGKTGAYGLPLIQRIDPALSGPQAVVICPTRELCLQIADDLRGFAAHVKNVGIAAVYGGASISIQMRQIKEGARIIVATPGRLLDLINRGAINLAQVSCAVLDEADEMLNMGFQEDIDAILGRMPSHKRIWLFSATMPSGVAAIARNYLVDPVEVTVGGRNSSPGNITHICFKIQEKHRYECLKRMIDFTPEMFGLVFCRTRRDAQTVAESLVRDGYQAEALHGDLPQAQRDSVMRRFRQQSVRLLVATDVAARGLDVDNITHVIHYNLPDEPSIYTHRSGRTARAGKSGASIVLINSRELHRIRTLEKKGGIRFRFDRIPDGRAICEKQLFGMVERIVQADGNPESIAEYLPSVYQALSGFDREELVRRLVSLEFNRLIEHYRHAGDINVTGAPEIKNASRPAGKPARRKERASGVKNTQRFLINVGRLDNINAGAIVRLICDHSGIRSNMIGAIDLNREFSFFEVEKSAAVKVRNSVHNARLDGRQIQIREMLDGKKPGRPDRKKAAGC